MSSRAVSLIILCIALVLSLCGCEDNYVESYINPDYRAQIPRRVAVLLTLDRTLALPPHERTRVDQQIADALHRIDAGMEVIPSFDAQTALDRAGAGVFLSSLMFQYESDRTINAQDLRQVCAALGVDGVFYGRVEATPAGEKDDGFEEINFAFLFMSNRDAAANVIWSANRTVSKEAMKKIAADRREEMFGLALATVLQTMPGGKDAK